MKFATVALILFGVTRALDSLLDTDDTVSAMMRLLKGDTSTSTEDIRTLLGSAASPPSTRRRPKSSRTNVQERQEMVQKLKERLQLLDQKETDLKELERDLKTKKAELDRRLGRANSDAKRNVVRARQLAGTDGDKVRKLRERIDQLEDKLRIAGLSPSGTPNENGHLNRTGQQPFSRTTPQPPSRNPLERNAELDQEIQRKEAMRKKLNEILNRLAERLTEKVAQLRALHAGQMPLQSLPQTPTVPGPVPGQPLPPAQPVQQVQQPVVPQAQLYQPQAQPYQQPPGVPQAPVLQPQPWTPTQQPQS